MIQDMRLFFWFNGIVRCFIWTNNAIYHTFVCCPDRRLYINSLKMHPRGSFMIPFGIERGIMHVEFYCYPFILNTFNNIGLFFVFVYTVILILSRIFQADDFNEVANVKIERLRKTYPELRPRVVSSIFRRLKVCMDVVDAVTAIPYFIGMMYAFYLVHESMIPGYYIYLVMAYVCDYVGEFFSSRSIPEKNFPRVFDYALSSQNIWYICNIGVDIFKTYFRYLMFVHLRDTKTCEWRH